MILTVGQHLVLICTVIYKKWLSFAKQNTESLPWLSPSVIGQSNE